MAEKQGPKLERKKAVRVKKGLEKASSYPHCKMPESLLGMEIRISIHFHLFKNSSFIKL